MTGKDRVIECLRTGRANALSQGEIALMTGMSRRMVREIITELVVSTDLMIGSATEPDGGYYIIQTAAELREALLHLYPREAAIRKRRQALEAKGARMFGGQVSLWAQGEG